MASQRANRRRPASLPGYKRKAFVVEGCHTVDDLLEELEEDADPDEIRTALGFDPKRISNN